MRFYREGLQRRTDDDGCCLRNFANLFILLHDFLNARLQKERKIGKDASYVSDRINDHHWEAYNWEFCRLVSIFHDGRQGIEDLGVTDRAGRVRWGNVCARGSSGFGLSLLGRL